MQIQMFIACIFRCKEVGTKVIKPFLEGHMQAYNLLEKMCFLLHWIGFQVQQAHVLRTTNSKDNMEEVGGLILGFEIFSLRDIKLWQVVKCLLYFGVGMLTFCLKRREKEKRKKKQRIVWMQGIGFGPCCSCML